MHAESDRGVYCHRGTFPFEGLEWLREEEMEVALDDDLEAGRRHEGRIAEWHEDHGPPPSISSAYSSIAPTQPLFLHGFCFDIVVV
jgi:hypothetical protein